MEKFKKRKHIRLKDYDYSNNGYYYVTINTKNNLPILSNVGQGLAPAECCVELSKIGEIAEKQLLELSIRYDYIEILKYVIMPTHIHLIIALLGKTAGASPRPTLTDIICAYKSLTTIECNKKDNVKGREIFQNSFYEKIIRNEIGYNMACEYIQTNPSKWSEDKYNPENFKEIKIITK